MMQTTVTHPVTQMGNAPVSQEEAEARKLLEELSGGRGTRTPKRFPAPHFEGRARKSSRNRKRPKASATTEDGADPEPDSTRLGTPRDATSVTHPVTHNSEQYQPGRPA
jgi:hypothetical protein